MHITHVLLFSLAEGALASTPAFQAAKIDLDSATAVAIPQVQDGLKPTSFKTPDGKEGWAIREVATGTKSQRGRS